MDVSGLGTGHCGVAWLARDQLDPHEPRKDAGSGKPNRAAAAARRANGGFATIASFLMVFFGIIILFITMQLSLELGKVEDQNQRLAEELALLKLKTVE